MSDVPERARRAFRDHDSFEQRDDSTFEWTTTVFDGRVTAAEDDGEITFEVTVRVPMLNAAVEDDVAPVVEDGWYETFELRVEDIGSVTKAEHDFDVEVSRDENAVVVSTSFADINERRGVEDAGAIIDYVEGTYVQGVIPGYEYTKPVSTLLQRATDTANSEGPPL
ncbi:hypothetical protein C499_09329 [Halogeometricum borinquense DSM 11551]|uniref:Uncharacterized protein n=2 Tax=Halogeometricum borinquense TaxID=60847 RepID=E4NN21_HALBP|nr:DUF5813 family protein [Halogeometricum borinquense]ADQ66251.1 hypothetical protein Hbor_06510 [Halogeometricum borinquense DSM 11551]ELY27253.1 hypothetical protein C499_09329 [Halogeometricum borinquense DSM 11551]RYJ14722.1 hypothetical protein ELS19_12685 [Halogeometricum borinquense]